MNDQNIKKNIFSREKLIKKGKRMKRLVSLVMKLGLLKSKKIGTERFVEMSYGKIRVLEYGFDDPKISPLFIDMHGGGFIFLSADFDEPINLFFREKTNIKIVSIDYPLAPESPYPIAVEAVYEVVEHYVNNAAIFKCDPNRVGIGGHSAGANLATVTCIRAKEKDGPTFKFQILDFPPLDLHTNPFQKPRPKKAMSPKMAAAYNACYTDFETAKSPHVSPVFATTEQLLGLPPALIIVAGHDLLHDEGVLYYQMLKKARVPVELHDFPNAKHGFAYKKNSDAKKAQEFMADFIKNNI
ncbi:MAG: alpha/beta hydrolase [Candidatus Lokiarchaeota archaeon]|nr:alpha/beta hydrolase [Candidatus Lokiarchaeota archaeon]